MLPLRISRAGSQLLVALSLITLIFSLPGCGSRSATPAKKATETLIYARGEDANTLDPIHTDIGEAVKVMVNIYDTLITYHDETTELVPGLATEWAPSEDGLKWTFKLRQDVKFHDGTQFDAAAVVFSFERLIQDQHQHVYHPARPYQPSYRIIKQVEATDPYTVVFTLDKPSAIFLQNMAMFPASIVSPAAVKAYKKQFGNKPIGTGPFRFSEWRRGEQIRLDAYEDHWRGPPGVERVIFLSVGENATRAQQLKRGESHIADDLSPPELESLATTPGMRVQETQGLNVSYLSMHVEKAPLNHRDVRTAIWHAIDKRALAEIAYGGQADPIVNLVPPAMVGYDTSIEDRAFDVAKAKELIDACAEREGFTLPVELKLAVMTKPRPYMPQSDQVASLIKDSLAKIGISVSIERRSVNQHFEYVMAGNHQLALAGWSSDNNDIDNFLYQLLDEDNISEHGNNLGRYRNAKVHELLIAGQTELDQAKRLELYHEAQRLIFDDAPVVPLVTAKFRVAQSDKVRGYKLHPTGLVRLRLAHFEDKP